MGGRALGSRTLCLRTLGTRLGPALAAALAAWLAAGLAACAPLLGARGLGAARPGATTLHTLRAGGRTRHFLLHLPPAAARGPVPLVLAFHGHLGNGAVLRRTTGLDADADALGVAVAYPDGTGALGWLALSWHADRDCCDPARARRVDDVAFARALVAALGATRWVDTSRVAALGFSAGGMLALRLACERAPVVRAAADVAGTMPHAPCAPGRPTSVLLVQGGADDELRGEQRALRLARAPRRTHSLENAMRFWAAHAGCSPTWTARDSSRDEVVERAQACPPGLAVELRTVADNPHAWPGGERPWLLSPRPAPQVDAARRVLEFFERTAWPGAAAVARAYADSVSAAR